MENNNHPCNEAEELGKKAVTRITLIGLFINVFLTAMKFVLGYFGKSQAVIADAIHSLSDLITDVAVVAGVKYWSMPADRDHPYGHKKIEAVITLFIGLLLGFVGLEIVINAITTISQKDDTKTLWFASLGPLLTIVIKEFLYHWTVKVGKEVKSSAVIANAWHHRSDSFSSIPAFVAVVISAFFPNLSFVDHIGAIIVSIFLFKATWSICKGAFIDLIDSSTNQDVVIKIESMSQAIPGVKSVHKIRTRLAGSSCFVDLHIQVDGAMNVNDGHEISEIVKTKLLQSDMSIVDVVVHLEPYV